MRAVVQCKVVEVTYTSRTPKPPYSFFLTLFCSSPRPFSPLPAASWQGVCPLVICFLLCLAASLNSTLSKYVCQSPKSKKQHLEGGAGEEALTVLVIFQSWFIRCVLNRFPAICAHSGFMYAPWYPTPRIGKCWWRTAQLRKDHASWPEGFRMLITPASHTENFIMKPKNHRSINTAASAYKVSGLQGKA